MPTKIIYGTYKDGGDIYKDAKGYYVIQWDIKQQKEYKKYLPNFKPTSEPYVWKIPKTKAKKK